jgi:hypothetical protein
MIPLNLKSGIQVGQRLIYMLDVGMPTPQPVILVSRNWKAKIVYPAEKQEV